MKNAFKYLLFPIAPFILGGLVGARLARVSDSLHQESQYPAHLRKYIVEHLVNDCDLVRRASAGEHFQTEAFEKGTILRVLSYDPDTRKVSVTILGKNHERFYDDWLANCPGG